SGPRTMIQHWDGTRWSVVSSPNSTDWTNVLNAVSSVSADDIWAVGRSNTTGTDHTLVEHWDGAQWSIIPSPTAGLSGSLSAVAIVSASDVWAAGAYTPAYGNPGQTQTLHWNGSVWTIVPSPHGGNRGNFLYGLAATSS